MTTDTLPTTDTWSTSRTRRITYRVLLVLSSLAAGLFGGSLLVAGWFSTVDGGSHRFHELSWGVLEGVVVLVGLLLSLWRPARLPVAYQQAVLGFGSLLVTMAMIQESDVATLVVGSLIVAAGLLHPARRELLRVGPWHGPSLIVGALTAAPLVWYAIAQAAAHRAGSPTDPHVEMAHYAGTTAAALALAALVLLAASRRPGRRVAVGSATVGLAVLGAASIIWPDQVSSFGTVGGAAALVAAAAVAVTGLLADRADGGHRTPTGGGHVTAAVLVLALGLLGGCADDDTGSAGGDDEEAASSIEVIGVDYGFEGALDEVAAGSSLTFTNASEVEVHELLVLRVDDDETRTLEELMEAPEDEAEQVTSFVGMQVALPGEEGLDPEDPSATGGVPLEEAGRYLLLCFIPEGADPEAYREAIEGDAAGPPDVDGGPPHAALGMAREVTVAG